MSRETPLRREDYRAWRRIETRWADNDVYGHVNNVVYYEWFDTAVNGWLIEQGLLTRESRVIGLVAQTGCTYFAPIGFPNPAEVGLAADRIGTCSITYRIGIFAEGGATAIAQGRFVHVCVDRQNHRPAPIPESWRVALERIA